MANFLTVIKDNMGYRLGIALNYDSRSHIFTMDNGVLMSGEIWLATPQNLMAVINNQPKGLQPVAGQMYWPVKPSEAAKFLDEQGWGVDKGLRLRPKLGAPFMAIKPLQIPIIISLHLQSCEKAKKEPEREPILLMWKDDKMLQVLSRPSAEGKMVIGQLPDKVDQVNTQGLEEGKICKSGNQICLAWQDYALIPKTSDVMTLHKFLKVDELADTIEEVIKSGVFLSKDGMICKDGSGSLAASGLTIDQFLK